GRPTVAISIRRRSAVALSSAAAAPATRAAPTACHTTEPSNHTGRPGRRIPVTRKADTRGPRVADYEPTEQAGMGRAATRTARFSFSRFSFVAATDAMPAASSCMMQQQYHADAWACDATTEHPDAI